MDTALHTICHCIRPWKIWAVPKISKVAILLKDINFQVDLVNLKCPLGEEWRETNRSSTVLMAYTEKIQMISSWTATMYQSYPVSPQFSYPRKLFEAWIEDSLAQAVNDWPDFRSTLSNPPVFLIGKKH